LLLRLKRFERLRKKRPNQTAEELAIDGMPFSLEVLERQAPKCIFYTVLDPYLVRILLAVGRSSFFLRGSTLMAAAYGQQKDANATHCCTRGLRTFICGRHDIDDMVPNCKLWTCASGQQTEYLGFSKISKNFSSISGLKRARAAPKQKFALAPAPQTKDSRAPPPDTSQALGSFQALILTGVQGSPESPGK
jgi:hypothetical protein